MCGCSSIWQRVCYNSRSVFQMEKRIRLRNLNPHITCQICHGYLIDATTVTECLHTFCKSCLVKHLEDNNTCPTCDIVIHQSHPLQYISYDRTMQDIVYKVVPNLQEMELKREQEFFKKRGLPLPRPQLPLVPGSQQPVMEAPVATTPVPHGKPSSSSRRQDDLHRADEQVNIHLVASQGSLRQVKRRFIRCSAQATVTHIKKFLAHKLYHNLEKYKDVDIFCNEELLGKDHTLKFVCITRWRFKVSPPSIFGSQSVDG
ncbi:PCGF3 [Cordylochernes scorpioides]|uniref:PCGF3 n=1 Tax=Cordylochernes scorpioides TaxID=51811 RepID=A0ABY6LAH9_9ARAC|nr:PCGF3 [Cordylochernes scorpioides]